MGLTCLEALPINMESETAQHLQGLRHQSSNLSEGTLQWDMLGSKVPKKEVVYFTQMFVLLVIILACIINLSVPSLRSSENPVPMELWVILLSTCMGCILPAPKLDTGGKHYIQATRVLESSRNPASS